MNLTTNLTEILVCRRGKSQVLWLLVSIAADKQAWFGKKGRGQNFAPKHPLIEGPGSAPDKKHDNMTS